MLCIDAHSSLFGVHELKSPPFFCFQKKGGGQDIFYSNNGASGDKFEQAIAIDLCSSHSLIVHFRKKNNIIIHLL